MTRKEKELKDANLENALISLAADLKILRSGESIITGPN